MSAGTEFAMFVQDRWRLNDRLMLELGVRADRDVIVEKVNYSPRGGVALSLLPDGRGILRGGIGKFAERTPLTVGAFTQYGAQTSQRFDPLGAPLGPPTTMTHVLAGPLRTPQSIVRTVAWDQRVGRRFFFKAAYLNRSGSDGLHRRPRSRRGPVDPRLERYLELLGDRDDRAVPGQRAPRPQRVVRALAQHPRPQRLRPVLRQFPQPDLPAQRELAQRDRRPEPADRPRVARVAGSMGVHAALRMAERVSVVGGRRIPGLRRPAEPDRPVAHGLDPRLHAGAARGGCRKYRFTAGLKIYNTFDQGSERDVQTNVAAPDYGRFYNPIQRSIGFLVSTSRP